MPGVPDDHPDREDGYQQTCTGRRDVEVDGDLGEQAGDDELGGPHQEGADGQDVDDERQPRGRGVRCGSFGGRARVHVYEETPVAAG